MICEQSTSTFDSLSGYCLFGTVLVFLIVLWEGVYTMEVRSFTLRDAVKKGC